MRIVLASRKTANHGIGGLGHVVSVRAEALAKSGHDVHLLTTPGAKGETPGYTLHALGGKAGEYSPEYADACAKLCRDLQPDVIHTESFDRFHRWWEDRPGNPKTVAVTLHGEDVTCSFTEYREWLHGIRSDFAWDTKRIRQQIDAMGGFDVVIATAVFDQWAYQDLLGIPSVPLVYNPIPEYFFEDVKPPNPNGPVLFCAVWGHQQRGFEIAKKACELAGVKLSVPRGVPRRQLVDWYDQCSMMILPSYQSNGFDLSVAECLARERCVVTSNSGLWWFEQRVSGECIVPIFAQSIDPKSLADSIHAARVGNRVLESIGGRVGQVGWYADRFRPHVHAEQWLEAVA